jgi:ketosteroid isomerase-like protein
MPPEGSPVPEASDVPALTVLADRLFGAVEEGDLEGLRQLYHPAARIWHNYDQREQTVEENLATLEWLCQRLFDRRYDVIRRDTLPDGFVQQHVLYGLTRAGEPFAMPACMVVRCSQGRITRIDEYLDPAQAAPLSH